MKKLEFTLFILILTFAFFVRLWRIGNPPLDWHAWRQADTSAVSRNFAQHGFNVLHPRFDDLSNVPSGQDNPQGLRFVEFPLYNIVQAGLYTVFGIFTLEIWGRLVSVISSLGSLLFLYLLTKKYLGTRTALLAAFFFGLIPYNIYYSRTILPDPSMVMAIMGGTYFFDRAIEKNFQFPISNFQFLLAILFTACAFLLKPFALFFTFPMIYLAYRKWGITFVKQSRLWVFAIVTLAPLLFWRMWMQQYPEGIPQSAWLFNEGSIRFKGAFFYWIFADRIGRLILGYWGLPLLLLGLIRRTTKREGLFLFTFLVSSLSYLVVIAGGNVKHDYYQILIVPTLAIFLAKGADFLLTATREYLSRVTCYLLLVACCAFMFGFSWYHVRDYFNINNPSMVAAGEAVDRLTPKGALVIAPNEGDTSFLYQTKRRGWASFEKPLAKMIAMGADYLVLTNPTPNDFSGFGSMYKIVSATKEYILFDLKSIP